MPRPPAAGVPDQLFALSHCQTFRSMQESQDIYTYPAAAPATGSV